MIIETIVGLMGKLKPKEISQFEAARLHYADLAARNMELVDSAKHVGSQPETILKLERATDLWRDNREMAKLEKEKWEKRFELRKNLLSAIIDVSVLGTTAVGIVRGLGH